MVSKAGAMLLLESSSSGELVARAFEQLPLYAKAIVGLIFFIIAGVTAFAIWAMLKMLIYALTWRERAPFTHPDNFEKKLKIANAGDALACYQMGELWLKEIPLTRRERKLSRKYYRKALKIFTGQAINHDPFARFMLGEMYSRKLGLKWHKALYFFLIPGRLVKLCENHYYRSRVLYTEKTEHKTADAYRNLGILNENGWGGETNKVVALENYKKAADLGDFASQHKAAHMLYADNKPDEAAHYYLLAAKNPQGGTGDAKKAQINIQTFLGDIYRDGIGRPVSMDEAYFWYSIAASRGDLTAAGKRLSLEAGLDTKTKLATQTRLKEFHRQLLN